MKFPRPDALLLAFLMATLAACQTQDAQIDNLVHAGGRHTQVGRIKTDHQIAPAGGAEGEEGEEQGEGTGSLQAKHGAR